MKIKFEPVFLLRLFLGSVLLSAAVFRVFNWQEATLELSRLNLNFAYLPILIIALEIIGGLFLILNFQIKKTLLILAVFLTAALLQAFIVAGENLIRNASELFTFKATPTDVFLHFTYLLIIVYLLISKKNN